MTLIDKTYFQGRLLIPNTNEPDPNNRTSLDLNELIAECEEYVLSLAFGREMYLDLKDNRSNYSDLINGVKYEKDDNLFIWDGLISTNPKRSLIADYTYYQWNVLKSTQSTDFGEVSPDVKIGRKSSSAPKMVNAWNSFIRQFYGGGHGAGASGFTYDGNPLWAIPRRLGNGYGISYYGSGDGGSVPLLKFLDDNKDDYPLLSNDNIYRNDFQFKNSFGL